MATRVCALAAFISAAAASSMMPQLSKTAQIKGDGRLAAVACCGADRSAISAALGATKPSAVAVVEGSTTLALLDGQTSVAEGALAVAASQVVLLEVRLADLTEDGPNGVSQAAPLIILASATCTCTCTSTSTSTSTCTSTSTSTCTSTCPYYGSTHYLGSSEAALRLPVLQHAPRRCRTACMSYRMHVLPHAFMPVVLPVLLPASQLVPLLRRSVRLAADAPKKLLLLAVVDHEPTDASEAELTAIAAAQLEQLWSRVHGPEVDAPAAADVFELQCVFLPHPKAPAFGAAAEGLKGTVVEAAGRWCSMVTPWAQHQRRRRRPFAAPPGAPEFPRACLNPPP